MKSDIESCKKFIYETLGREPLTYRNLSLVYASTFNGEFPTDSQRREAAKNFVDALEDLLKKRKLILNEGIFYIVN